MNAIETLLNKYCPTGCTWQKLGEIGSFKRGNTIQKSDLTDSGFPCIHYGQIYTYYHLAVSNTISFVPEEIANKTPKAHPNDNILTLTSENIDDVCTPIAWLGDTDVAVSGHAVIFSHHQNARYIAYYLKTKQFFSEKRKYAKGAKVVEVKPDDLAKIRIPVPPLEVQNKIVEILDRFTSLEAELEAELEGRKKQYYYYRNFLINKYVYTKTKLSNVVKIQRGKRLVRKDLQNEGKYPVYQNSLVPLGYNEYHNCDGGKTLVIAAGAAGDILYSKTPFWAADDCYYFIPIKQIDERYLYYALKAGQQILKTMLHKGGVPRLSRTNLENFEIPLPDISEQSRIADILDKFELLTNDLAEGLPAEIIARRKQYEYYRDKLLTFKRKEETAP